MINTLRITAIIAAILAAIFVALPAFVGAGSDEGVDEFLDSPSVIEQFKESKGPRPKNRENQESPLVRGAKAFGLYLNPPPKPKPPAPTKGRAKQPRTAPRPSAVKSKFNLVATSYFASHPEMSLALIDEPGSGLQWVRQSGKLGHLIIERVKDGIVVVKDGDRTYELAVQKLEKISLLKSETGGKNSLKPAPTLPSAVTVEVPTSTAPPTVPLDITGQEYPVAAPMSPEEKALIDEYSKRMQILQNQLKTEEDWKSKEEEIQAMSDKLMAELQAVRVGSKEAENLKSLGKELKDFPPDSTKKGKSTNPRDRRRRGSKLGKNSKEPNKP